MKVFTAACTSCGLALKTLLKTPIYCDGSTMVILTSVSGSSSSNAARSLFGSGTSLASLRCAFSSCRRRDNKTAKCALGLMFDADADAVHFLSALASSLCFNVEDGQFVSRSDLIDAPTCSLARGAPVAGLGEKCLQSRNSSLFSFVVTRQGAKRSSMSQSCFCRNLLRRGEQLGLDMF